MYTPSHEVLTAHEYVLSERAKICQNVLKRYEKPPFVRVKGGYDALTKKEINYFRKMGCVIGQRQQSLF